MKITLIAAFVVLLLGSCGNSGDKNTNDLNSVKMDSSVNTRGTDTIENPGRGAGTPDSLSHSGSNDQKEQTMKDSSNTKQ